MIVRITSYICCLAAVAVAALWPVQQVEACIISNCMHLEIGYGDREIPPNLEELPIWWDGRRNIPEQRLARFSQDLEVRDADTGESLAFEIVDDFQRLRVRFEEPLRWDRDYEVLGLPEMTCVELGPVSVEADDGDDSEHGEEDGDEGEESPFERYSAEADDGDDSEHGEEDGDEGEESDEDEVVFSFRTGTEELPEKPESLGPLIYRKPSQGAINAGPCGRGFVAQRALVSIDTDHIGAWAPFLDYHVVYSDTDPTLEDNDQVQVWSRRLRNRQYYGHYGENVVDAGRGRVHLFVPCEGENDGDSQGRSKSWAIKMVANLPGTDEVVESQILEVAMSCDGPAPKNLTEKLNLESAQEHATYEVDQALRLAIDRQSEERVRTVPPYDGPRTNLSDDDTPWILYGAVLLAGIGLILTILAMTGSDSRDGKL